jgi:hypothetical protein
VKQRCPKCGEPPRVVVITKAKVRCQLNADGSVGKVLSTSLDEDALVYGYECGGSHMWRYEDGKE